MIDDEQLVEFVTDPFRRHDLEARRHLADRFHQFRRRRELVAGDEAGGTQHPQRIVAEADVRADRCAQYTGREIDRPVERIDQRGVPSSPVNSSAMALTVKSRRDRSASISSANTTCGLRESSV